MKKIITYLFTAIMICGIISMIYIRPVIAAEAKLLATYSGKTSGSQTVTVPPGTTYINWYIGPTQGQDCGFCHGYHATDSIVNTSYTINLNLNGVNAANFTSSGIFAGAGYWSKTGTYNIPAQYLYKGGTLTLPRTGTYYDSVRRCDECGTQRQASVTTASLVRIYGTLEPTIYTDLEDTIDTIEGKDTQVIIGATFPSGIEDYQWQKSENGVTWTNLENGTAYKGVSSNKLSIRRPSISDNTFPNTPDGTRFRCYLKSNTADTPDTISKVGTLKVAPKNYESIEVRIPKTTMNIGDKIMISEVLVILQYDNFEFKFASNFPGLSFVPTSADEATQQTTPNDPPTTEVIVAKGINNFTVLLADDTHPCFATLTVTGVDEKAPDITSVRTLWNDGSEYDRNNLQYWTPTADTSKTIQIQTVASDNVSIPEDLVYRWYIKNGETFEEIAGETGANLTINQNGVYKFEVEDENGNVSEKVIAIEAWDNVAPTVDYQYDVYGVNPYVTITINATDNIGFNDGYDFGLAGMRYKFKAISSTDQPASNDSNDILAWLNIGDWSLYPVVTIAQNTTYYAVAKDAAGNIAYKIVDVTCIPNEAPTIEGIEYEEEDGSGYLVVSATSYDQDDDTLLYYLDGTLNPTNRISLANTDVTISHTVMVKDIKDNSASVTFTINSLLNYVTDGTNNLASVTKRPLTWTNNTGVTLTAKITDVNVAASKAVAFVDITDGIRAVTEEDFVSASGTNSYSYVVRYDAQDKTKPLIYRVFVKTNTGSIYHTDMLIDNIDATAPTYTAPVFDGFNKITFQTQDVQSGLFSIQYKLNKDEDETTACIYKKGITGEQNVEIIITDAGTYDFSITDNTGNKVEGMSNLQVSVPFVKINNPNLDYTNNTLKDVSIIQNPTTWTNTSVTCSVSIQSLGISAYSWDGGVSWGGTTSIVVEENKTVNFMVKDTLGNVFTGPTLKITNIDKEAPTISETGSGISYKATCEDTGSGIKSITVNGISYESAKTTTYEEGTETAEVTLNTTENGTYSVTVIDHAGNKYSKSMYINNVTETDKKVSVKTVYKETPVEKIVTKTEVVREVEPAPAEIVVLPQVIQNVVYRTAVKTDRDDYAAEAASMLEETSYPVETKYSNGIPTNREINNPVNIGELETPLANRLIEMAASPVGFIIILILLAVIGVLTIMYIKKSHRVYKYKARQDRKEKQIYN